MTLRFQSGIGLPWYKFNSICFRFHQKWDFPNCIGCIDGKHILLQKPDKAGSEFYNYKGRHSIVLMGICDASYKFTFIDVGKKGSGNDAGIWEFSPFNLGLEQGKSNSSRLIINYLLLGLSTRLVVTPVGTKIYNIFGLFVRYGKSSRTVRAA